ncbi:MAG: lactate utilization protein [Rhodocyclaceae bacterium]|nr:lactate utilization protein [Rhodocyclaceae bacterium]
MSARERIIGRLRAAGVPSLAPPAVPVDLPISGALPGEAPLDSLRRNLEAAHAVVIDARPRGWRGVLAEICAGKGIRSLLLPPAGVALAPWPGGPELRRFDRPIEEFKDALFGDTDAGLTVAGCAIADTGTLVHADPAGQPRTLSLVPPIHVCLLDPRRLHANLGAAIAAEGWAAGMPSNLVFVSGPSKTADIQQTLAYGAHGPKELFVLLTEEDPAAGQGG